MINIKNIYFFNSSDALIFASNYEKSVAFYNGKKIENAPKNCINVPIENFANYFLHTIHKYPQNLSFDGMNFSDEVIKQISINITDTLTKIKAQKSDELNKFLTQEMSIFNVEKRVYKIVEHIKKNSLLDTTIPFLMVKILLEDSIYICENKIELSEDTKYLIETLREDINQNYQENLSTDILLLHITHSVDILSKKLGNEEKYFEMLADFENLKSLVLNFSLVKIIYPQEKLLQYIKKLSKPVFNDDFFKLGIVKQKMQIFKLYSLVQMNYDTGIDFREIYYTLKDIFTIAIKKEMDELVMFMYYPLQYSWNGVAQTQQEHKEFNDEIELKLESFIKDKVISKYNIKPNLKKIEPNQKKIKVAFLIYRVLGLSVDNVLISLLQALKDENNQKYEFVVYDLNFQEAGGSDKKAVENLKATGIRYVDLHQECSSGISVFYSIVDKCLSMREYIMKENIDILIGHHSRAEYNFLFTTRTAPRQIYWSHGNFEYSTGEIDERVCHFDDPLQNLKKYKYNVFTVNTTQDYLKRDVDKYKKEAQIIKERWQKDIVISGSIGRLVKLDNDAYIEALSKIMKHNKNLIYLACGTGNSQSIKKRIEKYDIDESRFYFEGFVDFRVYAHIIEIYLNTFPMIGGESVNEFLHNQNQPVTVVNYAEIDTFSNFDAPNIFKVESIALNRYIWDALDAVVAVKYNKMKNNLVSKNNTLVASIGYLESFKCDDYIKSIDFVLNDYPNIDMTFYGDGNIGKFNNYLASLNILNINVKPLKELEKIDIYLNTFFWKQQDFLHHISKINRSSKIELFPYLVDNNLEIDDKKIFLQNFKLNFIDTCAAYQNAFSITNNKLDDRLSVAYIGHQDRLLKDALTINTLLYILENIKTIDLTFILNEDCSSSLNRYFKAYKSRINIIIGFEKIQKNDLNINILINPIKYHNDFIINRITLKTDIVVLPLSFFTLTLKTSIKIFLDDIMETDINKKKFSEVYNCFIDEKKYFRTMLDCLLKDFNVQERTIKAISDIAHRENNMEEYLIIHLACLANDNNYFNAVKTLEERWYNAHQKVYKNIEMENKFIKILENI